eukprot:gene10507-19226_t
MEQIKEITLKAEKAHLPKKRLKKSKLMSNETLDLIEKSRNMKSRGHSLQVPSIMKPQLQFRGHAEEIRKDHLQQKSSIYRITSQSWQQQGNVHRGCPMGDMWYADDVVLMATSRAGLGCYMKLVKEHSEEPDLKMYAKKT